MLSMIFTSKKILCPKYKRTCMIYTVLSMISHRHTVYYTHHVHVHDQGSSQEQH